MKWRFISPTRHMSHNKRLATHILLACLFMIHAFAIGGTLMSGTRWGEMMFGLMCLWVCLAVITGIVMTEIK